ncbi:MAG: elongation factor EF-2 [Candidatus Asgardarchaeum californiense]|nr:MAG: elongation factor EF-2 [Candidatus Asgardarchaeum californiense]
MVRIKGEEEIRNIVKKHPLELRRIFSIVAHIDHGKSTACDYLMRRAGLLSDTLAGDRRLTDYDEEEQERGITIFTSVALLNYEYEGKTYLFELNDTPGHISFTGEVSRALRGSDGAVVLVDALEGVMTQTETNIKLAVGEEWVKPILFINKVDRLIRELKLPPEKIIKRFEEIIKEVNKLIEDAAPKPFKEKWKVNPAAGSVVFGSAKDGWAFTIPLLQKKKLTANIVLQKYAEALEKNIDEPILWLRRNLPLDEALLEAIIRHLPSPIDAQKYRMVKLWQGDIKKGLNVKSMEEAKNDLETWTAYSLINVRSDGPLLGMITKIFIDPRSKRPTLIGRVFSGTIHDGETIYLVNAKKSIRIRRLGIMEIDTVLPVDEIPAGNLFACQLPDLIPSGETFTSMEYRDIPGFEKIVYASEPVVSRSIKPKNPRDLGKLGEVVNKWVSADPTATFTKDEKSGEYILSGIDPLQIEILVKRIQEEVPIDVGIPITVYQERPLARGVEIKTKCTEGHNKLQLYIEPLDEKTQQLIKEGKITEMMDSKERARILREEAGWDTKHARNIWAIEGTNVLVNATSGVQRLDRAKPYIISTFREFMHESALAKEPGAAMKVVVTDAFVHEDPAHTRAGQLFVMTLSALNISFLTSNPALFEPILRVDIKSPVDYMSNIIAILQQRRGKVLENKIVGDSMYIRATIPASEAVKGFADTLRGATQGRAFFGYQFEKYDMLPKDLQIPTILEIRKRKKEEGKEIGEEIPTPFTFKARMYPDAGHWRNAIIEHMKQYGNKLVIKEILEKSLGE